MFTAQCLTRAARRGYIAISVVLPAREHLHIPRGGARTDIRVSDDNHPKKNRAHQSSTRTRASIGRPRNTSDSIYLTRPGTRREF